MIFLQRSTHLGEDFDCSTANIIFSEYSDLIEENLPTGPKKQIELLRFHESCLFYYNFINDNPLALFHFRIIANKKNMNYLLSRPEFDDTDKFLLGIGLTASNMWKNLLADSEFSQSELLAEMRVFVNQLNRYTSKIVHLSTYLPALQNLLNEYKEILEPKAIRPAIRKEPSPKPKTTVGITIKPQPKEPLTILSAPTPLPITSLPLPLSNPTLRIPEEQRHADRRLKKKLYLAEQKKMAKKQSQQTGLIKTENTAVTEKIYILRSKLGHVISATLSLPPKTSLAIISLAKSILEKGVIGVKNNQVKFVDKNETKKMDLPESVHYKIKGTIPEGDEKSKLVRIYGNKNPVTKLIEFSILVRKPHKADSIECRKAEFYKIAG